ncbi:hypothetical protein HPP92_013485 [Vanilla planifolia]|uniref:Glutamyl-tRNA(Gln) amidotransferase subunit C, chloroplastic/mitochondrial n=1 Tax=Vanilla planifolia TaxID=51239 RepID=A0A835V0N5_VANPL|nr:hypothetical protein HPP92_013485 [Vanilla planifolia]
MASWTSRTGATALELLKFRPPVVPRLRLYASEPRCSSLQPPDVQLLADAARISLSPKEMEAFAPKVHQVVNWFGQLQAIDLQNIEPSVRADTDLSKDLREDLPESFGDREAILSEIPNYDEPFVKVPKVINKE